MISCARIYDVLSSVFFIINFFLFPHKDIANPGGERGFSTTPPREENTPSNIIKEQAHDGSRVDDGSRRTSFGLYVPLCAPADTNVLYNIAAASLTSYVDGREKGHVQHQLQIVREPHLERLSGQHGGGGVQHGDGAAGGQQREPTVVRVTVVGQRHGQYPTAAAADGGTAGRPRRTRVIAHQTSLVVRGHQHLQNIDDEIARR